MSKYKAAEPDWIDVRESMRALIPFGRAELVVGVLSPEGRTLSYVAVRVWSRLPLDPLELLLEEREPFASNKPGAVAAASIRAIQRAYCLLAKVEMSDRDRLAAWEGAVDAFLGRA